MTVPGGACTQVNILGDPSDNTLPVQRVWLCDCVHACSNVSCLSPLGRLTPISLFCFFVVIQGTWMGLLTAAGSAARAFGPMAISNIYAQLGPRVAFPSTSGFVLLTAGLLGLCYRRLVPYGKRRRRWWLRCSFAGQRGWENVPLLLYAFTQYLSSLYSTPHAWLPSLHRKHDVFPSQ